MRHLKLLFLSLLITGTSFAQVGIGTIEPDPSSMLDLQSNSQGLLVPRMTTAERNAIDSPAESLMVYDTTDKTFYYYNATTSAWAQLNQPTAA